MLVKKLSSFTQQVGLTLAALGTSIVFFNPGAIAAERVLFRYGVFQDYISIDELANLAFTGESNSLLGDFLRAKPDLFQLVRRSLKQEISISLPRLDNALSSRTGELLLDQLSQIILPSTGYANRQALRAAMLLSASQDSTLSLLEILKNYPTPEVVVDGERLDRFVDRINRLRI